MSGNFAIKGGGVRPLMANAILNFHFDFLTPSLIHQVFSVTRESSHSNAQAQKTESILTNCAHVKYKLLMNEDIFFNNLE